jgi:hypothetical protein
VSVEWIAIAFALGIASSPGGEGVRLEIEGELPCSEAQLIEAVSLRVDVSTAAVERATVRGIAGGAEVSHRGQVRRVELGRSTDVAAARRIALAVSDLVRGPVTVGLPPLEDPPPVAATIAPTATTSAPAPAFVSMESRAPLFLIGPYFRAGAGDTFDRPRFAATIDASIAIVDPLRAVLTIGAAFVPPEDRAGFTVRYVALLAGAGLGLRFPEQAWEARLLGGAETYFVTGDGIERQVDVLPALEAAFLYGFELGGGFEFSLGASVAYYFARKRFEVIGEEILTTEQVVVALAVGVTWGEFR